MNENMIEYRFMSLAGLKNSWILFLIILSIYFKYI